MALATFAVGEAQATEGYFQYGYGARQGALAGAGVADSRDAMSLSLNPAGLVDVGRQFQIGASLFMPYRSYTATGTGFIAPGSFDSGSNYFVVPNIAYSSPIDGDSAWGLTLFGNGGMNTNWPNMARSRRLWRLLRRHRRRRYDAGVPGSRLCAQNGRVFLRHLAGACHSEIQR